MSQKVVTTDALLTQRTFCKEVLEHQADYALPVKENHKQMYDDIQQLFEPLSETDATEVETRRFENLHTQEGAHLHTYTHVETSHGLTTTRTLTASTLLTDYIKWPGIAQVYQYQSQRENTKTQEITSQTQYGITSLSPEVASAEDLLKLRREHWTIENKVHWVRDTVLGTLHRREPGVYHKSSQHYATRPCLFYASQDIQKSLKPYDFSLQNLNSQLNSSNEKLEN